MRRFILGNGAKRPKGAADEKKFLFGDVAARSVQVVGRGLLSVPVDGGWGMRQAANFAWSGMRQRLGRRGRGV
jgi:hypothetical protein